jgi:hypothetical protein
MNTLVTLVRMSHSTAMGKYKPGHDLAPELPSGKSAHYLQSLWVAQSPEKLQCPEPSLCISTAVVELKLTVDFHFQIDAKYDILRFMLAGNLKNQELISCLSQIHTWNSSFDMNIVFHWSMKPRADPSAHQLIHLLPCHCSYSQATSRETWSAIKIFVPCILQWTREGKLGKFCKEPHRWTFI